MSKKILIILGHPDQNSLSGAIADHYETAASDVTHEVQRVNLGDLTFDPILRRGYREVQPLEPDLVALQEQITWADHLVIVYPNWWCTMPALLKGMFDRLWLPDFSFNFNKQTGRVEQRLKGKTARVFIISGTQSPFRTWWNYGDYTNEIQHGILGFAGVKAAVTPFGPSDKVTDSLKTKWLLTAEKLGRQGK